MDKQGRAIKIPLHAFEKLKAVAADIAQYGWAAYGIERSDPAVQTAVIEEAIECLAARRKASAPKRRKR